jgi:hypothetical protein
LVGAGAVDRAGELIEPLMVGGSMLTRRHRKSC